MRTSFQIINSFYFIHFTIFCSTSSISQFHIQIFPKETLKEIDIQVLQKFQLKCLGNIWIQMIQMINTNNLQDLITNKILTLDKLQKQY